MVAKKTKKKIAKRSVKKSPVTEVPAMVTPIAASTQANAPRLPAMKINPRILAGAAILVGVGALTYKLGPWMVPAIVDKTPVTRWQVYERMNKNYGAQTLDDMINEKILDKAIAQTGVTVSKADVDAQIAKIEEQFKSMGGLDAALESRGLTKNDLVKQVTTQLQIETILKDKIAVSDDEVKKYFDENSKTLYKDKKLEDVKNEIVGTLRQSKLQEEFLKWFAEAKKSVSVKNFAPTPIPAPTQAR